MLKFKRRLCTFYGDLKYRLSKLKISAKSVFNIIPHNKIHAIIRATADMALAES